MWNGWKGVGVEEGENFGEMGGKGRRRRRWRVTNLVE